MGNAFNFQFITIVIYVSHRLAPKKNIIYLNYYELPIINTQTPGSLHTFSIKVLTSPSTKNKISFVYINIKHLCKQK